MELLFAYYSDYRNIKNQGFNFSSEYLIHYSSDYEAIKIQKNDLFIKEFFPKPISNVTVIVGENGVGKSSALNIDKAKFLIFKEKDILVIICEDSELRNRICLDNIESHVKVDRREKFSFHSTLFIHYSNYIDSDFNSNYSSLISNQSIFDFSTSEIVKRIPTFYTNNNNSYIQDKSLKARKLRTFLTEIQPQMQFLFENDNAKKLAFKIPETLTFTFSLDGELTYFDEISNSDYPKHYRHEIAKSILVNFLENQMAGKIRKVNGPKSSKEEIAISKVDYALFVARWSMFFSFINSFSTPNSDSGSYEGWLRFNNKWFLEPIENWFEYFFNEFIVAEDSYAGSKYADEIKAWSANATSFIKSFENLLKNGQIGIKVLRESLFHAHSKYYGLKIDFSIDITCNKLYPILYKDFLLKYFLITDPDNFRNDNLDFMTFSWRGISTGEMAMFRLFSRINQLKDIIRKRNLVQSPGYVIHETESLIFLIDEGDLGFHPFWQQKYLSMLVNDLPLLFNDINLKYMQIILTTHSPFVLSDVTNSHVIFLEKTDENECKVVKNPLRDKRNTFGANIHSLLSDGFFLNEGLIGHYAKVKINDLIDSLIHTNSYDPEQCKLLVNQIGEPLIKKRVHELYQDKLNIERRIFELEKELESLKIMKNDSDRKRKP